MQQNVKEVLAVSRSNFMPDGNGDQASHTATPANDGDNRRCTYECFAVEYAVEHHGHPL